MSIDSLHEKFRGDPEYRVAYAEEDLVHRIGLRILQVRKSRNMSQRELAELVGTKQPAIAKLEGGYANPSARRIARIAFALKCRPEELLSRELPIALRRAKETDDPAASAEVVVISTFESTRQSAAAASSDVDPGLVGVA